MLARTKPILETAEAASEAGRPQLSGCWSKRCMFGMYPQSRRLAARVLGLGKWPAGKYSCHAQRDTAKSHGDTAQLHGTGEDRARLCPDSS